MRYVVEIIRKIKFPKHFGKKGWKKGTKIKKGGDKDSRKSKLFNLILNKYQIITLYKCKNEYRTGKLLKSMIQLLDIYLI